MLSQTQIEKQIDLKVKYVRNNIALGLELEEEEYAIDQAEILSELVDWKFAYYTENNFSPHANHLSGK